MKQPTVVASLYRHPPERLAVIYGDRQVTFGELCRDVDRAAGYLRASGLGPESKVAIFVGPAQGVDDYATWIAHLAAMRIGASHASIHDRAMLGKMIELIDFDALIGKLPAGIDASELRVVPFVLDDMTATGKSADDEGRASRLNATSGTTGAPKIVRWDNTMIASRVDQIDDLDLINEGIIFHSMLAPRTTAGFRYPLATWRAGGTVILSNAVRAADGTMPALRADVVACSPFQLARLPRKALWPDRESRTIIALGGRLPRGVRDWALTRIAGKIVICYGSTEAGNVASGDSALIDRHPGAVGFVRQGVEVDVVGADGEPVAAGETGAIRIRSHVMAGDDGSKADGYWFEPGDRAVLFEDGLLAIAGRSTDVLNFGGMKLSAVDIESKLSAIDAVEDAAMVNIPGQYSDLPSVAIVAKRGFERNRLVKDVRAHLPKGVPCPLILVASIPRNEMGKIDRRRLARQMGAHLSRQANRTKVNA